MSWQNKFAIVVIGIVAAASVYGGFLVDNNLAQVQQLREEAFALQDTLDRMEARAIYLVEQSHERLYHAGDIEVEAFLLDIELEQLNVTLIWDERDAYLWRIIFLLNHAQNMESQIPLMGVFWHFNTSTSDMVLATEEEDGFDYNITYNQWLEYETDYAPQLGSLVTVYNSTEYYGGYFSYDYIQSLPAGARPINYVTGGETFVRIGTGITAKCEFFFYTPVRILQDDITARLELANSLESLAKRLSLGVSLTTVAMILATAVASRFDQHIVNEKLKTLLKEEGEVRVSTDIFGIVLLVLAILLVVATVYIPLI
ncbi:MAG: hypothetical protein RTV31_13780 [Candidatus Thorarchaeota archaeon]